MRKFRCIKSYKSGEFLTKDNIYYEKDGRFKYDDGWVEENFEYNELAHFDEGLLFDYLEEIKKDDKVMRFDIKKEKIAVLCNTKEKVEKLCEMLGEKMFKNFHVVYPNKCYVRYDANSDLTYDSRTYFTYKRKDYKLITFEEFMEEKEDIKMELKVGDRVEILGGTKQKGWNSNMKKYIGTKGTIVNIFNGEPKFKVKMDLDKDYWFFNKVDLKLASNTQPQQFTITVSDSSTTLTSGDKTVEIKRYYTDKHDVKIAIDSVVKKYFDEVEMEEKKKNRPTKGKDLIGIKVPKGTKFKVINIEPHNDDRGRVCLSEYIGKIGTFNNDFIFTQGFYHTSGTFDEEYMNAIDKKNGRLCWRYDEVEILWED